MVMQASGLDAGVKRDHAHACECLLKSHVPTHVDAVNSHVKLLYASVRRSHNTSTERGGQAVTLHNKE